MDKANLNTIDGTVWAKEFMRLFGERRHEIDEALMIGWFCNSIMRGFDEATRREQEQLDRAKAALELIANGELTAMRGYLLDTSRFAELGLPPDANRSMLQSAVAESALKGMA